MDGSTIMILYVIGWIAGCVGVLVYADRKGKSGIAFFLMSLILSPVIGFIIAAAVSPDYHVLEQREQQKQAAE